MADRDLSEMSGADGLVAELKRLVTLAVRGVEHAEGVKRDTDYDSPLFGESTADSMRTDLEELHEPVADLYIALSGKRSHASDCATSNAPAVMPGPCDCTYIGTGITNHPVERLAINLREFARMYDDPTEGQALDAAKSILTALRIDATHQADEHIKELREALEAADRVINHAAEILWNCRPNAVAARPASIDRDLRFLRAVLAKEPGQ